MKHIDDDGQPVPHGLSREQYQVLRRTLHEDRVAKRDGGQGRRLSYLEGWDVRAHLTRIFGFANWDARLESANHVLTRPYIIPAQEATQSKAAKPEKSMLEVAYSARVSLTIRCRYGCCPLASYSEAAIGSESGPDYNVAELHDHALKTAATDALKRCATNLGNQFGLSLYNRGSTKDAVGASLVHPERGEDWSVETTEPEAPPMTPEKDPGKEPDEDQTARIGGTLGGQAKTGGGA